MNGRPTKWRSDTLYVTALMRLNAWAELANALGLFDTIGNLVSEIENRTILDIDDR